MWRIMATNHIPRLIAALAASLLFSVSVSGADSRVADQPAGARVGVFYFPGWKDNALGAPAPHPWDRIKAFPKREPLLGWYPEGDDKVMAQQLKWMHDYGINFVVFDWYWNRKQPMLDQAVVAYTHVDAAKPGFAFMWANGDASVRSEEEFDAMIRYLLDKYARLPEYLTVAGRPVIFVQIGGALDQQARSFGSSAQALIARAQALAKAEGLPGLFFVAGAPADPAFATGKAKAMGYSGYSSYNYHSGPGNRIGSEVRFSHTYGELDNGYRAQWKWFMANADLPYIVPMTSGWDKTPWGGSKDPDHDHSESTPAEFKAHLEAARRLIEENPAKTLGMGIVCCWNEFGEGSIVEPTKSDGFTNLNSIKAVFGPHVSALNQ